MMGSGDNRGSVAVIGAGAIGGVLTAALAEAGHDVTLCVRTPVDGLTVETQGRAKPVSARILSEPRQARQVDWVFVTTKAQDTAAAAPWFRSLCGPHTVVVAAQNGVDHEERLRPVVPDATILPAVVYCSAERLAPGLIRHHQTSRLVVAEGEAGQALTAFMAGSIFAIDLVPDIRTATWRKLLSNVAANPITALTLRRHSVFREPDILSLFRALLREAVAAGRAAGADLSEADAERILEGVSGWGGGGGSSMLYDRLAGRPLEHEYITGAVVAAADRHGIDVPLNRAILALLRASSGHPLDGTA